MKGKLVSFFSGIFAPVAAFAASSEGVPSYYKSNTPTTVNQAAYSDYQSQGYTKYVGQSGSKQVVGNRTYSYQVPVATVPTISGTMTANGIALPADTENGTHIYAGYSRRFADFEFETGVNSILEWDDMIFNEINVGARHNFSLRNFDMFAYADYSYGKMSHGGLSMDYDLKPFDESQPEYGIFTISVGDESGETNHLRIGFGAHHIWDIGGWKLSPSIGYEIFKHDLQMSDHYYPNPGIYLPLMTSDGKYVYGNDAGEYFAGDVNITPPDGWYQVCMSPEDIKLVQNNGTAIGNGFFQLGDKLVTGDYNPSMGLVPWGVGPGDCVIIGGDGPSIVHGTTHIYNTTWSGFYIGLEIEKQMTLSDKLRFYVQFGLPKYSSEGIWPNRDDWQQNPSFLDEGSNGSYSYRAEMEYNYKLSNRLQLALKVDMDVFHVGKIGGKLYVAEYGEFLLDENGQYILEDVTLEDGTIVQLPKWVVTPAHTEDITDSLKRATWQSFGLHLGLKYAF